MPPSPQCAAHHHEADDRWFRLWKNTTELDDPVVAPCVVDQLRLIFDRAAGDYRNVPGVETRVLDFVSAGDYRGVLAVPASAPGACRAREQDERGQAGRPRVAQPGRLLRARVPQPEPHGVAPEARQALRHGVHRRRRVRAGIAVPGLRRQRRLPDGPCREEPRLQVHVAAVTQGVRPRHAAGGHAGQELPELLTAVGLPAYEVTLYKTRALPVAMNFRAPAVPTTCINGVGVPTTEKLVYWDGDFSQAPEILYGDGDGVVNSASILALHTVIGEDPRQGYYKSVKIAGTSHDGVVSDGAALERLVSEIARENFVQASKEEDSRVAQL